MPPAASIALLECMLAVGGKEGALRQEELGCSADSFLAVFSILVRRPPSFASIIAAIPRLFCRRCCLAKAFLKGRRLPNETDEIC